MKVDFLKNARTFSASPRTSSPLLRISPRRFAEAIADKSAVITQHRCKEGQPASCKSKIDSRITDRHGKVPGELPSLSRRASCFSESPLRCAVQSGFSGLRLRVCRLGSAGCSSVEVVGERCVDLETQKEGKKSTPNRSDLYSARKIAREQCKSALS